jgi:hypothetical protein
MKLDDQRLLRGATNESHPSTTHHAPTMSKDHPPAGKSANQNAFYVVICCTCHLRDRHIS